MTPASSESVVRQFFEAWNTGDIDAFDDLVHPEFEEVWAPPPGYGRGPAGARASYAATVTRFSQFHFELEDLITEGNSVACRTTFQFTSRASGELGRMIGMNFFHLLDGKLSREWYIYLKV